jgi:hypothetical protein
MSRYSDARDELERDLEWEREREPEREPERELVVLATSRRTSINRTPERSRDGLDRQVRRKTRSLDRHLDPIDRTILATIGKFRSIHIEDITHYMEQQFPGNGARRVDQLRQLGMVQTEDVRPGGTVNAKRPAFKAGRPKKLNAIVSGQSRSHLPTYQVVCLTHNAVKALLNAGYDREREGSIGSGLQKHKELFHDSKLFQMTQQEIETLKAEGARVVRIETDMDLKARVNRKIQNLAKIMPMYDAKRKAAEDNELAIMNGKIMFPDVRLEYRDALGQQGRVDLELTSDSYSKAQMAGKRAAGMKCYALQGVGHSITDDHHHAQEIFSI